MAVTPRSNLAPDSQAWGRSVDDRIGAVVSATKVEAQRTLLNSKQIDSTVSRMQQTIIELDNAVAVLKGTVSQLDELSQSWFAEDIRSPLPNAGMGGLNPLKFCSIQTISITGGIKATWGIACNGNDGYATIEIIRTDTGQIIVDPLITNPSVAIYATGGASFSPTYNKVRAFSVPTGVPLQISIRLRSNGTSPVGGSGAYFYGANLFIENIGAIG